jgi:NADPH:quinone reductase-like Zn-dependent oxidoreductase
MPTPTHDAAILLSQGGPLSLQTQPTQRPGPNQILINVKSIALNPVDYYMRDFGFLLEGYPAIPGSDIAGTIAEIGSGVSSSSRSGLLKPGARVAAFAMAAYSQGKLEHGGFQKQVIVPAENVVVLPDNISFHQGASLPMAVLTAWSGMTTLDLSYDTKIPTSDKKGMLVWGAASSIGLAAVQIASRTLGFTVYAVASTKHENYIKSLGGAAVFDYHDPTSAVIAQVIAAAKRDNVAINLAYHATGELKPAQEIVAAFGSGGATAGFSSKVATAVPLSETSPTTEGVDTRFILPPPTEQQQRDKHFEFVFARWLRPALDSGEFVPAPQTKIIPGGLAGLNAGLDELKAGVSAVKLVVEL